MKIEVQIRYSIHDEDWEINVWKLEDGERKNDLERVFPTEHEANEYVESLDKDKSYIVNRIK